MTAEPGTRVMKADSTAIEAAARCFAQGGLVAFATETVYGLGADAANGEAVARLYAAKGRPAFNPLIAHVADVAAARRLGRFDAAAEKLAAAFWPGPLTLVLPKRPDCGVADLALAGLDTIAVRVPAHPIAHALLEAFGGPIVAPSANRSGHVSPTTAGACARRSARPHRHGDRRRSLRGGRRVDHRVLRSAPRRCCVPAVSPAPISNACLGANSPSPRPITKRRSPPACWRRTMRPRRDCGSMPKAAQDGEALLGFGAADKATLNLSPRGDLVEAAANLFSHLRALDASGAKTIAVMKVPHEGLGEAINDRLMRAAAPKTGQAK